MTVSRPSRKRSGSGPRVRSAGFTLIEVMVAVLILAFGLLGFGLLQTMNVRFTQSANHRTHATNLAYGMLDQMRVNRLAAAQYEGDYEGVTTGCTPDGVVSPSAFKSVWECRLGSALGEGASATVDYDNGEVTISITWGDQRWEQDAGNRDTTFTTSTRL